MGICRVVTIVCFTLFISVQTRAQSLVSMGFYNVENLYDTIPSLFYDDSDYTPDGRLEWNEERYSTKLKNLSQVIDHMSLDVLGLAEVESEAAVRDLVMALDTDYNYVHRTSSDSRGIDLVLLYKGDKFIPDRIRLIKSGTSREFLYVRGELSGSRIDVVVCHLPSQLNTTIHRQEVLSQLSAFADSLHRFDADSRLVVMGDFNTPPSDRIMRKTLHSDRRVIDADQPLFSPFQSKAKEGLGTYSYNNRWQMLDNIFLSVRFIGGERLRYRSCEIFIRPYMLSHDPKYRYGYPLRTFSGGVYTAGYSDHLPVCAYFTIVPN